MLKTAIFLYEPSHVAELPGLLSQLKPGEAYDLIACDRGIEFMLEEKGIPFVSAKGFRHLTPSETLLAARIIGRDVMRSEAFAFFNHKGVLLSEILLPVLQFYLMRFFYFFDIAASLFKHPYGRVIVYAPSRGVPIAGTILETLNISAVPDAFRIIGRERGVDVSIVAWPSHAKQEHMFQRMAFTSKRRLFSFAMNIFNTYVRLFVRPKKIHILATEMWKNISSLMAELPDTQLTLLDRMESFNIGMQSIMRNRMQFMHTQEFTTRGTRALARDAGRKFKEHMETAKKENALLQNAELRGHSLAPILEEAVTLMAQVSAELVEYIEGAFGMMDALKPDVLLVRASTSGQTHFAILCETARLRKIPSIEVQHGIFSVGPQTLSNEHAVEYIAGYGPLDQELWARFNYAPRSKFLQVGSPRFDAYVQKNKLQPVARPDGKYTILHIATIMTPGSWNDSYDVEEYFRSMASAARAIPNARVVIKLRAGPVEEYAFKEIILREFKGVEHVIAQYETLIELFAQADVIVSCHSTAVLEALVARKPVVLDASLPIYNELDHIDFQPHQDGGALKIADTTEQLTEMLKELRDLSAREALSSQAERFVLQSYLFADGNASKRLAEQIRLMSQQIIERF